MAIQLRRAGFSDLVLLEQAEQLGGTWHHNRYPGCECDIPSHLYSFSFAPKADWTKPYGRQGEILEYLVVSEIFKQVLQAMYANRICLVHHLRIAVETSI